MASRTVTLEQVARHAGVSPSTVSRILNGTAVVSDDKKQAVEDAIRTLGFVPNPVARGLAGGRTLSIGVVTQAIDSPFYGAALRGIEDCYRLNERVSKTAIFEGWKEMDQYMRENKIEGAPATLAAPPLSSDDVMRDEPQARTGQRAAPREPSR